MEDLPSKYAFLCNNRSFARGYQQIHRKSFPNPVPSKPLSIPRGFSSALGVENELPTIASGSIKDHFASHSLFQ